MYLTTKKTFTLTLLVSAALANAHIHQRDHVNLNRLIKKRAPPQSDILLSVSPVAGAAPAVPTSFSLSSSSSDTASVTSTSVSSTSVLLFTSSTSHSSSASESSTSTTSSVSDTRSSASESSTSTSSSVSSTPSSTSTTSTPSVVVVTTSEQASFTSIPQPATTTIPSKGVVTLTSSVDPSQSATVVPQTSANTSAPKSTAVTALIVVGSSVAAIAILWTVFRKWKLGHSSKFDERLQPIDWRPTTDDDGALPGHHRRHSGASSFRSAGHLPSNHGHGPSNTGHDSPSSYVLPDHDFTAGPAHLAPVGGYADLARGPSPQPQMNQAGGATLTRPAYDVGVPLHHQGFGSQDSYEFGTSRR